MMFVGVIGLIAFLVFLVLMIIASIKKKPKKMLFIGLIASIVVFGIGVSVSPTNNNNNKVSIPTDTPSSTIVAQLTDSPSGTSTVEPTVEPTAKPTPEPTPDGEGDIGKFHVAIKDIAMSQDYEGNNAVIVTYEWTNNDTTTKSFWPTLEAQVFQNGIECKTPIMKIDGVGSDGLYTEIKPGVTYEFKVGYTLDSDYSEIEVEIKEMFSFSSNPPVVSKTFELQF